MVITPFVCYLIKYNFYKSFTFNRLFVLKTWFAEKDNFTYGGQNNELEDIGHYTQMVWASTHKLGCAFKKCKTGGPKNKLYYSYVCNYCPP